MSVISPDGGMPLLELHAVHFNPQGVAPMRAEELVASGASADELLAEALARAASHPVLDRPEGADAVQVTAVFTGRLTFLARGQVHDEPLLQIPLLMAHVGTMTLDDDASALLALAPQSSGPSPLEVWIMRVSGREPELQAALGLLSKSGAVRHDLPAAYVIGPLLARGGFASVYRAQQHDTSTSGQAKVAIKVVPTAEALPQQRQVRKEVELQLLCHEHQNVTKLVSVFQADGSQFADDKMPCWAMALSLAAHGDLFDWVLRGGSVSESFAVSVMQGLLTALRHVHNQGIFHRDVKPENVLLSLDMRPLLSDFGVATRLSDVRKRPIQCGPAGCTAPEILLNMEPTTQSDIFSAGCVLFFMMTKQRPFIDPDLATAVNSALTRKLNLDQFVELQESPSLKELLGALMERSPLQRPDANAALGYSFLQMPLAPHPPPTDPSARAHQRKQAFAKMMTSGEKQAPSSMPETKLEVPHDDANVQDVSLLSFEGAPPSLTSSTSWMSCFADSRVRCEPLVFRRRYVVSGGSTKSFLQIKPVRELLEVMDLSHTIWQTLELSAYEQVPLEVPDDSEPYSPLAIPEVSREPPSTTTMHSSEPTRMATGQIRSVTRQNSGGKKFRIDSVGPGGMSPEMGDHARGQMSWWMHSQQAPMIPGKAQVAPDQANRDLFGTCQFTQERAEDGRRRRLVKRATIGDGQEGQEEDFDDTASWQSWRSGVMSASSRRSSRGRSGSVMSMVSNASAVAMRELLAASDDEPYEPDDDYAIGPPADRTLSGRSTTGMVGLPVMHRLSIPGVGDHPPKRPMLAPAPPASARESREDPRDRDWGTCVFGKDHTGPGRGRRLVKPMIQQHQQLNVPGAEDEETARSNSWMSFAGGEVGRSLSQASMMSMASEGGGGIGHTPSGFGMQELLADNSFSPERPRQGRRGTEKMLQDLYAASEYAR